MQMKNIWTYIAVFGFVTMLSFPLQEFVGIPFHIQRIICVGGMVIIFLEMILAFLLFPPRKRINSF